MKWWRSVFGRRGMYNDLSEEIEQHLLERTQALMAQGLSRKEAALAARREFGNVAGIEERSREVWRWPVADSLLLDAKFAVRQLRNNYSFALTAIVTLALGIGASTAIFSLVHAVLLRPLSFPDPEQLMWVNQQDRSQPGVAPQSLSYPDYFDWRASNGTFSGIASYEGGTATLEAEGEARHLDVSTVSANFFQVLGVAPMLGRDFRSEDEKSGNRAVMLSYSLW